jgi:antitoxin ParD1/3/4
MMAAVAISCHPCDNRNMATQTSMNISLPDSLRRWVEQRVATEGYGTTSEYFRALVREDQKRLAREKLDRKLLAAIESGRATEMTPRDWAHIRSTVRSRLSEKTRATG